MNPTEYAKTLVEKYMEFASDSMNEQSEFTKLPHAKQCALICVEEIISILEGLSISESGTTTIDYGQLFYQQVKQDIQSL